MYLHPCNKNPTPFANRNNFTCFSRCILKVGANATLNNLIYIHYEVM